MGKTIIDYLYDQRASFDEAPFNDIDSLVLSTVAYFGFENGAMGKTTPSERVPLPVAICGVSQADLFGGIWLESIQGKEFLHALLESPRFMALEAGYYINEVSSHFEKQFAAITFFFPKTGNTATPNPAAYIAFRGTDNSIAGWKENFNFSFMKTVPSQVSAQTYLEDVADAVSGPLLVGGHSKGGYLAEYAALSCREQTFARIDRVFNHDGPGLTEARVDRIDTPEYQAKLRKSIPGDSIVGMLMENRDQLHVVKSQGRLFFQHASTNWEIEGTELAGLPERSTESVLITGTFNKWTATHDIAERELFYDTVFGLLEATQAETLSEMNETKTATVRAMAEAYADLSPDMRSKLLEMLADLAPLFGSEAARMVRGISEYLPIQKAKGKSLTE